MRGILTTSERALNQTGMSPSILSIFYVAKRYRIGIGPMLFCLFVCWIRYNMILPSASRRACVFSLAMVIVLDGMEYENENERQSSSA